MKTLFIVRHAKSDWNVLSLQDIDRSLNTRGYKDAHAISKELKEKKAIPQLIVSSPAIRAISTALVFARNLDLNPSLISIKKDLYDSDIIAYINVIKEVPNDCTSLMLFGHNPIITDFANSLTTPFSPDMPTCAVVGIQFDCDDWKDIKKEKGILFLFDYPKKSS